MRHLLSRWRVHRGRQYSPRHATQGEVVRHPHHSILMQVQMPPWARPQHVEPPWVGRLTPPVDPWESTADTVFQLNGYFS